MGNVKTSPCFVGLLRRRAIASPEFCQEREGVEAEHWHFATIWKHFQRHLLLFFFFTYIPPSGYGEFGILTRHLQRRMGSFALVCVTLLLKHISFGRPFQQPRGGTAF